MSTSILWYNAAARGWTDALPLGNGRLGAMTYGGVAREEFQLNEATLWSGGPYRPNNPDALSHLNEVRELIFAGRYAEAEALTNAHLLGKPATQMSYQPAGNLFLEFTHEAIPGTYRRSLDLTTGIAETRYRLLGAGISDDAASFTRTSFVSLADDVLVINLTSDRPAALSFEAFFDSPQPGDWVGDARDQLSYRGTNFGEHGIEGQLRFGVDLHVRGGEGRVIRRGRRLCVQRATSVTLILDIATSFVRFDDVSADPEARLAARSKAVAHKDFEALKRDHIAAYRQQFDRFDIDLGPGRPDLPTDQRIANYSRGDDPALAALYVQYGRYLTVASSQPGTQPANLQGIWNKDTRPPWGSKYTTNINLEMNYWLADTANLSHCVEPLIALVEDLAITGAETARVHYGARGWVLHHNTDLWRATAPIDGAQWGMWPTGGAWLCAQLWDHAVFAGRPSDLVERLLPLMRGAVLFALDVLQPLPGSDILVIAPSVSPENTHPQGATVCAGASMDNQILRDLFNAFLAAADQLGSDQDLAEAVRTALSRLPPDHIGAAGQLQEWLEDWDLSAPEPNHRHVSHLYGLYPSLQISPETTPELAAAARRSLDLRGDFATGWGIGWRVNLWARLRDGERAHETLKLLLSPERSYANLFDAHPPFQIDGNFGGAAGVLEMLVQSTTERIWLLPACPQLWSDGSLKGVRLRGGIEMDLRWSKGRPEEIVLRSRTPQRRIIMGPNGPQTIAITADTPMRLQF